MDARRPDFEECYVRKEEIEAAVEGHETTVLAALGISDGPKPILCPYPDHDDKQPSWRWDDRKKRAFCTCSTLSIINVARRMRGGSFEDAKLFVAEAIGRLDLIHAKGERRSKGRSREAPGQSVDALLSPLPEQRDETLPARYLGARLGIPPREVLLPSTLVVGWRALPFYDPPEAKGGKPTKVASPPCVVFELRDRDGKRHAMRTWTAPDGCGKADLGEGRSPKKAAAAADGDLTAGRAVFWGDAEKATTILLCEGAETAQAVAQTVRMQIEAGEYCVAAAMSANGVAAFRPWPTTKTVIVMADRDEGGAKPSRAGEKAARRFALANDEAVEVRVALPGEPGEKCDWLDVLLKMGEGGVSEGIEHASRFQATSEERKQERDRREQEEGIAETVAACGGVPWLDRIDINVHCLGNRVWWYKRSEGLGGRVGTTEISTAFGVTARLKRIDESGRETYGKRIVVQGPRGEFRTVDVWAETIVGPGATELLRRLVEAGLAFAPSGRQDVPAIIVAADPKQEVLILSRPGWHQLPHREPFFVAPDGTVIGAEPGALELDADARLQPHVARSGTLERWKAASAAAINAGDCQHWALAVMAGFAGPLVDLLQLPTTGLVLTGETSTGKTTALELSVSNWSNPDVRAGGLAHAAYSTPNAVESLAAAATGSVLMLDELKHLDGKGVTALFYMLGGGGKARLDRNSDLRQIRSWRSFAILSSEMGVRALVERDGAHWQGGMAVRLADVALVGTNRKVPAETFSAMAGIKANFGHAGPAFVEALIEQGAHREPDELHHVMLCQRAKLLDGMEDKSGALERAADPFALIWLAGALAQQYRLIPEALDVGAVVHWAWDLFRQSGSAAVLEPVEEAMRHLQARIAEGWDVTIRMPGISGSRDAIGWYDDEAVYIPKDRLFDLAGGFIDANALSRELSRRDLIAARKRRQLYVEYVRGVGRVDAYALSRKAFGRSSNHVNE